MCKDTIAGESRHWESWRRWSSSSEIHPLYLSLRKMHGSFRLCGDYKVTINPALVVDQHPLPKHKEIFASLAGGQSFTKLDLSHASQQLLLDDASKDLVTINAHLGLYHYTRLPFGVSSAPAIFQCSMEAVLRGLPRILCYLDDIIITRSTEKEHLATLSWKVFVVMIFS